MRGSIRFSIGTLVLAVSSSAILAQSGQVASSPKPADPVLGAVKSAPVTTCCLPKLAPEAAARIARRIDEASGLTLQGQMSEARRILREVITEQEQADAYPAVALRMLANVEFGLDRPIVAARILIDLADAAAEAGDPPTELQALVDASILFGQSGQTSMRRSLRPRISKLLNSPAIPEATRLELARHFAPE